LQNFAAIFLVKQNFQRRLFLWQKRKHKAARRAAVNRAADPAVPATREAEAAVRVAEAPEEARADAARKVNAFPGTSIESRVNSPGFLFSPERKTFVRIPDRYKQCFLEYTSGEGAQFHFWRGRAAITPFPCLNGSKFGGHCNSVPATVLLVSERMTNPL
jgi:hypothetical protein